jgi:hypothetical protein
MQSKNKTFSVTVEQTLYTTGSVEVKASSAEAAIEKVRKRIAACKLQTTDIFWGDHYYQDGSFQATGDVEEVDIRQVQSGHGTQTMGTTETRKDT